MMSSVDWKRLRVALTDNIGTVPLAWKMMLVRSTHLAGELEKLVLPFQKSVMGIITIIIPLELYLSRSGVIKHIRPCFHSIM